MVVYKITNTKNGMLYVGITTRSLNVRWRAHLATARGSRPSALHAAINKYGQDAFTVSKLDEADTFDALKTLEKKYIAELNTKAPNGYNKTFGGQGVLGMVMPEEARKAIGEKAKLRGPLLESTKNKIREALVGRRMLPEQVARSANARRGATRTIEQKERITKGNLGKNIGNSHARKYPVETVNLALALLKQGVRGKEVVVRTGLTQSYVSKLNTGARGASLA